MAKKSTKSNKKSQESPMKKDIEPIKIPEDRSLIDTLKESMRRDILTPRRKKEP